MATVIDSLIVELGLDASKFNLQQREAFETAKRLEAQQVKAAKNIEHESGKAASSIGSIRTQAIAMFAAFSGGQGLVQFGLNMVHTNAQLGRLGRNLGESVSEISKWQGAARIFGGSAEAMAQSYTTFKDAFYGFKVGEVSPLVQELRNISAAGGVTIETFDSIETAYKKLSQNFQNIEQKSKGGAGFFGRRAGFDPAFTDLLAGGPANLEKILAYNQKIGVSAEKDVEIYGELEKRINQMGLKAESLARQFVSPKEKGGASVGGFVMELADVLNMSPGDAWTYLNRTDRQKTRNDPNSYALIPKDTGGASTGSGAFTSQAEKEAFIRAEAAKRGINPNIAMAVAKAEGFDNFQSTVITRSGQREQSFGAFQLYMGGGLGNEFQKATGLDPRDRANERAGIQFALDRAAKGGWTPFHGAANNGIGQWAGIDRNGGQGGGSTQISIENVNVTAPNGTNPQAFANSLHDALVNKAAQMNKAAQINPGQSG